MSLFRYRAVHHSGKIHKGEIHAANENELAFLLAEMKLELISAAPKPTRQTMLRRHGPERSDQLVTLCRHLETMLSIGIPFIEALSTITASMPQGSLQRTLDQAGQKIRSGHSISQAFTMLKEPFDEVSLSLLKAGEAAGNLPQAFASITEHIAHETAVKRDLSRALRYPLFLLLVACSVTSFMMLFVVPQITAFLTNLGQDLPLLTRILIKGAEIFALVWWSLPLGLLMLALAYTSGRKISRTAEIYFDSLLLSVPLFGPILRKLALARFLTSLSMLLKSGLTVSNALQTATPTVSNSYLISRLSRSHNELVSGKALSAVLNDILPPHSLHMIAIAEKSALLPLTLDRIARNAKEDSHRAVNLLLGMIEPALTLCVGGLLAWIVLAVLGPLYGALAPLSQTGGMP